MLGYFENIATEARDRVVNVSARFLDKHNSIRGKEIFPVECTYFPVECKGMINTYKVYRPKISALKPVGRTFETPVGRR